MAAFFPKFLDIRDTATPMDVLAEAKNDWEKSTEGVLSLVFREAASEGGDTLIYVYAEYVASRRTKALLRVAHRKEAPFPLTIIFEVDSIPNYLKHSHSNVFASVLSGSTYADVENPWVCDTPGQFRVKLEKAFNTREVIAEVQSLVSTTLAVVGTRGEEAQEADIADSLTDEDSQA